MKTGIEHRVPLSAPAIELLLAMQGKHKPLATAYVFPGANEAAPLSNMAMLAVLKRIDRSDVTTHGFRSVFRDWAAEAGFPRDVAEAALAHVVGNKVEAAYLRTTLFEWRRKMMDEWASACSG